MSHLLPQEADQSRWARVINGDWDGCKEGWSHDSNSFNQQKSHSCSWNQKGTNSEMWNIHLSAPERESSHNVTAASVHPEDLSWSFQPTDLCVCVCWCVGGVCGGGGGLGGGGGSAFCLLLEANDVAVLADDSEHCWLGLCLLVHGKLRFQNVTIVVKKSLSQPAFTFSSQSGWTFSHKLYIWAGVCVCVCGKGMEK